MKLSGRILTLDEAVRWRESLAEAGRTLVVTNGCFDILHRGHAEYLEEASELGDELLVLVNSDASVRGLKGPGRPVNGENARAAVICALRSVSRAVVFDSARCDRELAALRPDVYVKGGDYTLDSIDPVEKAALLAAGSRIVFKPFVKGFSTTGIIDRLKQ